MSKKISQFITSSTLITGSDYVPFVRNLGGSTWDPINYRITVHDFISGSVSPTASYALNSLSSSYALTSSYAMNGGGDPSISGTLEISGTLNVTGSENISGTLNVTGIETITGSLYISGSETIYGDLTVSGTLHISGGIDWNNQGTIYAWPSGSGSGSVTQLLTASGWPGIMLDPTEGTGSVTIYNTGVTCLCAGSGITSIVAGTISGSWTINASGGGGGAGGVIITGSDDSNAQRLSYGNITSGSSGPIDTGYNTILGGQNNCTMGTTQWSGILGGQTNCIVNYKNSFIVGSNLIASADCTTYMNNVNVSGSGSFNYLTACSASFDYLTVNNFNFTGSSIFITGSGGKSSTLRSGSGYTYHCGDTLSGGCYNTVCCCYSTIGGGCDSTANADYSFVGGGRGNAASGCASVVAGGYANVSNNSYNSIGGGCSNVADGISSTIAGGSNNRADYDHSVIGGGYCNWSNGNCSGILGGKCNLIGGFNDAFIIGSNLTATDDCTTYTNNLCVSGILYATIDPNSVSKVSQLTLTFGSPSGGIFVGDNLLINSQFLCATVSPQPVGFITRTNITSSKLESVLSPAICYSYRMSVGGSSKFYNFSKLASSDGAKSPYILIGTNSNDIYVYDYINKNITIPVTSYTSGADPAYQLQFVNYVRGDGGNGSVFYGLESDYSTNNTICGVQLQTVYYSGGWKSCVNYGTLGAFDFTNNYIPFNLINSSEPLKNSHVLFATYNRIKHRFYVLSQNTGYLHIFNSTPWFVANPTGDIQDFWNSPLRYACTCYEKALIIRQGDSYWTGGSDNFEHYSLDYDTTTGQECSITSNRFGSVTFTGTTMRIPWFE